MGPWPPPTHPPSLWAAVAQTPFPGAAPPSLAHCLRLRPSIPEAPASPASQEEEEEEEEEPAGGPGRRWAQHRRKQSSEERPTGPSLHIPRLASAVAGEERQRKTGKRQVKERKKQPQEAGGRLSPSLTRTPSPAGASRQTGSPEELGRAGGRADGSSPWPCTRGHHGKEQEHL